MASINNTTLNELEDRWLDVDNISIRYVSAGSGRPLLLVHGLGNSIVSWRANIGPLSRDFKVFAIDLPGHGLSSVHRGRYDLDYAVRFMGGLMDGLGLDSVNLVGSSLGGLISMRTALDLPGRVDSLTLAGSAGLGRELALFLRLLALPFIGEFLARPRRSSIRKMLKYVLYNKALVTDDLVDEVHRYRTRPQAAEAILKIIRWGADIRGQKARVITLDRIPSLKIPVLIIAGAQDRVIPVSHSRRAHRLIKGSRLHIFDECGHWPQMEHAGEFNRLLIEFLQSM